MERLDRTQIHPKYALSCTAAGKWQLWDRIRLSDKWWREGMCSETRYVLDFAALWLRDVESFIVAISTFAMVKMDQFDEQVVAEIIDWANDHWELER